MTDDNDADEVAANIAALRADVARLSDSVATMAKHQADSASAAVGRAIDTAKNQVVQVANSAQDQALSVSADFERRVSARPISAVLIAAGLGMALGLMTKRRA